MDPRAQAVMGWIAVCLVSALTVLFFGIICWRGFSEKAWLKITQDNFATIVGLPAAAVGSLFLVLVLRFTTGDISVEGFGLKFQGAAAPIVFWVVCFLAMASAIKMLWKQ